jgi:hypothetical protein
MSERFPDSYYDIIEACGQPGCPLCRIVENVGFRFLTASLHGGDVTDPEIRAKYSQSMGFCHRHAWLLPQTGGGAKLGIAIIYRDFINQVDQALARAKYTPPGSLSLTRAQEKLNRRQPATATAALVKSLQPAKPCPACAQETELETLALTTLLDFLPADKRLLTAFKSAGGLCLPHLRRALELARSESAFTLLVAIAREKLVNLEAELDEFVRKHDYRYQHEKFEAEGDSWARALARMVGEAPPKPKQVK